MKIILSIVLFLTLSYSFDLKAQVTVSYTYDQLNRLTEVNYSNGLKMSYSYDALGNRTTKSITKTIVIVNLKLHIEGYYDPLTNQMRPVKFNQGTSTDNTVVDDISVELVHPTTLQTVAAIVSELKTDGSAVCNFPLQNETLFYLVVKHRNAIQTWSATPIDMSISPLVYDFSTAANKAFGSNLRELETGIFGLYSGDINQDENVDNSDYPIWEYDANSFAFGDYASDLNGDGNVDNTDYSIWEGNSNNFIYAIHPIIE